ncbi:hypothetical protein BD309DRAFT_1011741 [Dichomitus squalens]|nr:hypothetical protein BD309DRAFT_1011741 [Dichomitus squalens]
MPRRWTLTRLGLSAIAKVPCCPSLTLETHSSRGQSVLASRPFNLVAGATPLYSSTMRVSFFRVVLVAMRSILSYRVRSSV